ncbi:MAG: DUF5711 family protein [Oscillospiraceae bacterium]|nr:DUF5711 family protein [Oscillospiraceae bacterium]
MSADNVMQIYPKQEKPHRGKIPLLVVCFVVVIGAVLLILCFTSGHLDNLRRTVRYFGSSEEGYFVYGPHSGGQYALMDDNLVVASTSGISLFSKQGQMTGAADAVLIDPVLQLGKHVAMAYDVGGTSLVAMNRDGGEVLNLTADHTILDADISSGGSICYAVGDSSGYKTVLTALDREYRERYHWYSSSRFLTTCAISKNGSWMAAISPGQTDHTFDSALLLFRTDTESEPQQQSLGNLLVFDLMISDRDRIFVVGDTAAVFLNQNGTLRGSYDYADRYLEDFDFGGHDFLTLVLNMYKAGNRYSIVTVSDSGDEIANLYLGQEIHALSASGNYIAVLTSDALTIYRKDLTEYAVTNNIGNASDILMQEDGSVLLLGSESASLFLP